MSLTRLFSTSAGKIFFRSRLLWRWWIKSPRAHVCHESARIYARACVCACVRVYARALSTLLNSFLYYVFSESECNLPSSFFASPLAFSLRKPEGRSFLTARQGNKYPRTNCFCHLTSARRNDLIRITYKNSQHVDTPLQNSIPFSSISVNRPLCVVEWIEIFPGYWQSFNELFET